MSEELLRLFAYEHRACVYRVTFADGERYVLTALGCFGDDDDEQVAGRVVQPVVRRAEAERHFQPGKVMSFSLGSVREVADEQTGEVLYRAVYRVAATDGRGLESLGFSPGELLPTSAGEPHIGPTARS
jgi:hypothetical protein